MYWPDRGSGVDVEPARKPVASAVRQFFTEGGPGVPPTVPGGDWFNQITNEILNVLEAAGIDPSKTDDDQLLQAIRAIAESVISRPPSVSFIFDDAYASAETVMKPLFDTYGARFGLAVPYGYLGLPGRFTTQSLARFASMGYEVLNHATSGDPMSAASKGVGGVKAELATCWSALAALGIKTTGFQTPSSVLLQSSYADAIAGFCDYAFTSAASTSPLAPGTDPKKLSRFSIEAATEAECVAAIDSLVESHGALVFYMHDVSFSDANYNKVVAILNKCTAEGVDVLLPSECISQSVAPISNLVRPFFAGELLDNKEYNYTANNSATLSVSANKDVTVTLPSANTYLVQKVVNLPSNENVAKLINFSSAIRDLGGTATNCLVGIKLYSGANGTGTELFASVEEAAAPNGSYVRYFTQCPSLAAKSALIYHRITTSAAGEVLLRSPTLRFGTSIEPEKRAGNTVTLITDTIPTQSIAATGAYVDVTLNDMASNGLFRVTGNQLIFEADDTVHLAGSLVANGAGVATGFLGGSCAVRIDGVITEISPIAGGTSHLAGKASTTLRVTIGTTISFRCLVTGAAFAIGSANSRLMVTRI